MSNNTSFTGKIPEIYDLRLVLAERFGADPMKYELNAIVVEAVK